MRKIALVLFLLIINSHAFSNLDCLVNLPYHEIDSIGKVCEQLAHREYCDIFNNKNQVVYKNVEYTKKVARKNNKKPVIRGELDIVAIQNGDVIAVSEVKCPSPSNMAKAAHKAREQVKRFFHNCIESRCTLWKGNRKIEARFPRNIDSIAITLVSYKGSHEDFLELDVTREELLEFLAKIN